MNPSVVRLMVIAHCIAFKSIHEMITPCALMYFASLGLLHWQQVTCKCTYPVVQIMAWPRCMPQVMMGVEHAFILLYTILFHMQLLLERADLDGDGAVDYIEFLAATLHLSRLERDERLFRAFKHFDTEGTGFITREDIEAGLEPLGARVSNTETIKLIMFLLIATSARHKSS